MATPTGIELISIIKEELLKSAELTGRWEKKLRQIEHHEYSAALFVTELKEMVTDIVRQVLSDNSARHITQQVDPIAALKAKANAQHEGTTTSSNAATTQSKEAKPKRRIIRAGSICPKCGIGKVIKGNTAYGCSRWKEGCDWRKPFK